MTKPGKKFSRVRTIWLVLLGFIGLSLLVAALLRGNDVILFSPKGLVADQQHRLMVISTLIMLGFGVPILFFLYFFAWKYREDNEKAAYSPHSDHGKFFTFTLWALPTIIMLILASLMLPATQKLDPKRLIESENERLTIQVVALRWKWLFIYPDQNIATVNYVQIPVDTPVQFELTADETPMSSFWIPHLGGMLYAMTQHVNWLNLIANTPGDYQGSAAEINGAGFAGMRFITRVSSEEDFKKWVNDTTLSTNELGTSEYASLLMPSENNQAAFYSNPEPEIYSNILSKYAGGHQQYAGSTEHKVTH
ncbi:COX aromatic rich motif-containing protein [Candidatus Saccharibacteria bacterium]|nr:COX aromatic rich motif-containing protein [Candidatus Saccharibacteria bacterium]